MTYKFPNISAVGNTSSDNNAEQLAVLSLATLQAICELCDRAIMNDHACPTGMETLALAEVRKQCRACKSNDHPPHGLLSEEESALLALLNDVSIKSVPTHPDQYQACALEEENVFLPESSVSARVASYVVHIDQAIDQSSLVSAYHRSRGYLDALSDVGKYDREIVAMLIMTLHEGYELRLAELHLSKFS